jgi:probable HAF family extracellular repeat protein
MQELPPLPGTDDTTTAATAINDKGQVVGISGICDVAVGRFSARHAVLWENGVPTDIGSLGGVAWNTPTAINNQGVVVGFSDLPGDNDGTPNYQAFIWTQATGIQKLPLLPGETRAAAFGINDKNQVVGLSRAPGQPYHATLWQNGGVSDLNSATLPASPYLIYANDINDSGVLVGEAFDASTGTAPAFEAFPIAGGNAATSSARVQNAPPQTMPKKVRQQLRQRWGLASENDR